MTVTHPCHSGPMGFGVPGYEHIADTMCMTCGEGYITLSLVKLRPNPKPNP